MRGERGRLMSTSRRTLTWAEVEAAADAIVELLADPAADLTHDARLRWEGALTALEIIAGRVPSLPDPEIGALVRTIL